MSKGPGKWQRLILAELAERECFYLLELLPTNYRITAYNALHRAAHRLRDQGRIDLHWYQFGNVDADYQAKLLCIRLGLAVGERPKFCHERRNR